MKRWFAFVLLALLVSCNNDDDNKNNVEKRATRIYVDTGSGSELVDLGYDTNGNISSMNFQNYSLLFTYEGNRLSAIYDDGFDEPDYAFSYTNNIWTSVTRYGSTVPVSYNSSANSYFYSGTEFLLNGRSLSGARESDGTVVYETSFDTSRKGPLFSLPTESFFMMQAFSGSFFYLLEHPATSMNIEGAAVNVANTFDADGYLTEMVLTSTENNLQVNVRYFYE